MVPDDDNMPQKRFAIVIPALNEEIALPAVLKGLSLLDAAEVIVVDDFSDDSTASIARELGATVLALPDSLGAWGATQAGLRYAHEKQYPLVVCMDADGQHQPEDIAKLLDEHLKSGANIVIGSCVFRGSALRRIAWWVLRRFSGLQLNDLTSGFRLYDSWAQAVVVDAKASLLDYQDIGLLLMVSMAGLKITEVPVNMLPRQTGGSRVFRDWTSVIYYMTYSSLLGISKHTRRYQVSED